ncbi:MAG TPA: protein kinase [Terriglobales bacterium]
MALTSGTKLGPYEIQSPLGAGGMGEVYRARDTRLDRVVAVKILPPHLSESCEARQRFDREARAVSSLSHPHICHLYDVGQQDGISYLVMEFLEGETLTDRLRKGPMPLDQVLKVGAQICEGLEKAHRSGVVHRDLKPGNIMLTKVGAKLMDFGLAKAVSPEKPPSSGLTATLMSPDGNQPLTAQGTVVGTFQYMSPEQVEGTEADVRSDIFALGAVLYEMATGKRAFAGKSQASIVAAILASEPQPISAVQPMSPPALDRVVKTCLEKDPENRFQSVQDVQLQLRWIQESPSKPDGLVLPRVRRHRWFAAAATLLSLVLIAAGMAVYGRWFVRAPSVRAYIPPPARTGFNLSDDDGSGPAVLSPDGSHIAFVASETLGKRQLWVRALADPSSRPLIGTDRASYPFWSPSGREIGFFADGKIKRINVGGGPALDICAVTRPRGGSWSPDGNMILFSPDTTAGIFRTSVRPGSTPVAVTRLDPTYHTTHRWPRFLPDGKHFLYLAASHVNPGPSERNGIYWASLDGRENHFLMPADSDAVYASGYLLFVQNGSLMAQPFIPDSGRLSGDPVGVADDVFRNSGTWRAAFDATTGVVVFHGGSTVSGSQLQWFAPNGTALDKLGERDRYIDLRISPDNHKVAVTVGDPLADIWILDLARGTRTRFTFGTGNTSTPVWSPDGKYLLFGLRHHAGGLDLYRKPMLGTAESQVVLESDTVKHADDISPDGRFLIFEQRKEEVLNTLWVMPFFGDKKPYPLLAKAVPAYAARFSPDGKWVAYNSPESGPMEIYITSFDHGGKWQLTTNGGWAPAWRADGKAIYYYSQADGYIREAPVSLQGDDVEIGTHKPLFRATNAGYTFWERPFGVTSDGKRFLVNKVELEESKPISLVLNWKTLIAR